MESPSATEIYVDNNATTIPLPEVCEAVLESMGANFGNPSSVHEAGERGRAQLRNARAALAQLVGASPENLIFTAGGTESNNLVLLQLLHSSTPPRLVTTAVEHSSILKTAQYLQTRGVDVVFLSVDSSGLIHLDELEEALQTPASLVSVQWVNNETGVIQPVQQIAESCRKRGTLFHTDAAQALGKVPLDLSQLEADFVTLTAHKIHGPQGVGALFARNKKHLQPLLHGGEQESGLRAGTENLPGIAGMGKAAEIRFQRLNDVITRLEHLRDKFESHITEQLPSVVVNGGDTARVCNTSNLQFTGLDGQALVARLDQDGIRCSQSSACTNQRPEPSYVLKAMGLSESEAYASVRFGFSERNTLEEIQFLVERLTEHCQNLHAFSRGLSPASPS